MHFEPVLLRSDVFSASDKAGIAELVRSGEARKSYNDDRHSRYIKRFNELNAYAEKLVPVAKEIFGDKTLKPTYSVFLSYGAGSHLTMHKDFNACVYTIDYCVSSNTDWPLTFGDPRSPSLYHIPPQRALAFMGGEDLHGRDLLEGPDDALVENIMFHFCPADHWYFTEGPDYIKVLAERGEVPIY